MARRYRRHKIGARSTYVYRPRSDLLKRLHEETGLSYTQLLKQIREERLRVLRMQGYIVRDDELI